MEVFELWTPDPIFHNTKAKGGSRGGLTIAQVNINSLNQWYVVTRRKAPKNMNKPQMVRDIHSWPKTSLIMKNW